MTQNKIPKIFPNFSKELHKDVKLTIKNKIFKICIEYIFFILLFIIIYYNSKEKVILTLFFIAE